MIPRFTLRYISLAGTSGYATAAAALVRAMSEAGVNIVWEPMPPEAAYSLGYAPATSMWGPPDPTWFAPDLQRLRDDKRHCGTVIVHLVPEYYPYFIARDRGRGARQIVGHTVWETDRLPAGWPALINQLDAVIVPTELNREVFYRSGVKVPILVVPHLPRQFDQSASATARGNLRKRLRELGDRRIFYTISTWQERKGIAFLIKAFTEAFTQQEPVALVIKTTRFDLEQVRHDHGYEGHRIRTWVQLAAILGRTILRLGRQPPPIYLLTAELLDDELQALHEMGDCYVSLSRAEGWGLGAFEAAWLGKPVVVTGWGGPTAFLTPETAYFVDYSLVPIHLAVHSAVAKASYTSDQSWAEPDIGSAVSALRAVMAEPGKAGQRGAAAASHLRRTIVPNQVAQRLSQSLANLSGAYR